VSEYRPIGVRTGRQRSPAARDAAGNGFKQWEEMLAEGLRRDGVAADEAGPLATMIVSSLEGAVVLSRAQRTTAPLERVLDQIEVVIRSSVARASPPGGAAADV
jgi:hypothetical protein